jgi:hypothetical protein
LHLDDFQLFNSIIPEFRTSKKEEAVATSRCKNLPVREGRKFDRVNLFLFVDIITSGADVAVREFDDVSFRLNQQFLKFFLSF